MAFASGSQKGVKNAINVTPLVDVVLVLLIIFMVVTPMLQRGKDVHLPKAHLNEKEKKESDPLVVSMTADRTIFIEANAVKDSVLENKVGQELAKEAGRRVLLKGDEKLTVGDVRRVMDHIKRAGASGIELAIEEIKQ
ncbi:MAG TPA: biopolymer transporter ExbD [Polyangiaceae bacterium]